MVQYNNSEEDIKRILREKTNFTMDSEVQKKIRNTVMFEFSRNKNDNNNRSNIKLTRTSVFNSLTFKPMIPIIIAVALLVGGVGTAYAADDAKPGDALFGIDRALEQVQVNFSLNDTSKAERYVKIAQEREQEQLQLLEQNKFDKAEEAGEYANKALENAQEVIARVKQKHEEEGREQASESLQKVEENFEEIKSRFTERHRENIKDTLKDEFGEIELQAEVENGEARVQIEIGEKKFDYTLDTQSTSKIIDSIQERTGISVDDIKSIIDIGVSNDNSDDNSIGDEDSDGNGESEQEQNSEQNSDDDSDSQYREQNQEQNANNLTNTSTVEEDDDSSSDSPDEEVDNSNSNGNSNTNSDDDEEEEDNS